MGDTIDSASQWEGLAKDPNVETVLVAGCGQSKIIDDLCEIGLEAHGLDIDPDVEGERVATADVRDISSIKSGLEELGRPSVDVTITEKLLSCLKADEAEKACHNLRQVTEESVIHLVAPRPPGKQHLPERSVDEWKELCDPSGLDFWHDAYLPFDAEQLENQR